MKKNLFKFVSSELAHEQLDNLPALSHEICDLPALFFLLSVFSAQNLFLTYLIWTLFIYESLNSTVCHSLKLFLLLVWLLLTQLQLAWLLTELLAWLLTDWHIDCLFCCWLTAWASCLYSLILYYLDCIAYVNLIFFTWVFFLMHSVTHAV